MNTLFLFSGRIPTRWFLLLTGALLAGSAAPVRAQHHHGDGAPDTLAAETFLVEGLRVDATSLPPGSAVGRAGARLPGGGYLHVVYGKPYARAREVFGGLVAWDDVWVTGAHRATELLVTVPVVVGGVPLAPGAYSLFTTPRPGRWTLHLNRTLGMHLADEYNPAMDVLVVDAAPEALSDHVEAFTLDFVPTAEGVDLRLRWARTQVRFPIQIAP